MSNPLVLLTGMSGAGKSLAASVFEDIGWTVIDNLPAAWMQLLGPAIDRPLCIICDTRGGDLIGIHDALAEWTIRPTVVFLDATDEVLVRRFKETRRSHPMFTVSGGIIPAIVAERQALSSLKADADVIIDTTVLTALQLRHALRQRFSLEQASDTSLIVSVVSFGFKHGSPLDADLVFDVRFLQNPFYVAELRLHSGLDEDVQQFIDRDDRTATLLDKLSDLVEWTIPHYSDEGKAYLTIAIGCTGGRHRSVYIAERLGTYLRNAGVRTIIDHRDVNKGHH
ncbi:MAG: RNase adapter RapZ [Armatimonadaceae bacterium]